MGGGAWLAEGGQQMRHNKFAFCLSNFPFAFDYFVLSLGNLIDAQQLTKFGGNTGKGKGKGRSREGGGKGKRQRKE